MDLRIRKSKWKLYLAFVGVVIIIITLLYTNYLSNRLAEEEGNKIETWVLALEEAGAGTDDEGALTLITKILTSNTSIPVILVNDRGGIDDARNFGGLELDIEYIQKEVTKLQDKGFEPIQGAGYSIYYKESKILQLLRFFPIVQLGLITAFILFGYMGFNSARHAEQNRVWVGMAKETAHQLGTPISAIIAWIENLKVMREEDEDVQMIVGELRNDVNRLELIADRFSKIGSEPKMESINVYEELNKCRAYMERRAPRKVSFHFPAPFHEPKQISINPPLFDWVLENLMRNALDAMEGKGVISASVYEENNYVCIDLKDTGKGIPPNKHKTVFQPGYTTKKRGWGLGLSLAKRIIEQYHSGKIFVRNSVEGEGTTFTIRLPKGV